MDDKKRGDDAQDRTPTSSTTSPPPPKDEQDAPNYDKRTDKDQAIEVDDLSSANDEGAA